MQPVNRALVIGWIDFLDRRAIRFCRMEPRMNMRLLCDVVVLAKVVRVDVKKGSLSEPDQERTNHGHCAEGLHQVSA
jgi:hypothetical protein